MTRREQAIARISTDGTIRRWDDTVGRIGEQLQALRHEVEDALDNENHPLANRIADVESQLEDIAEAFDEIGGE